MAQARAAAHDASRAWHDELASMGPWALKRGQPRKKLAQFEREVTAERIRDKVAASKRKGMWMGGAIPLGYDVEDKALVVSPTEATAIRTIFAEYLVLGSVRQLRARLDALGIVSKQRTNRFGRVSGGTTFSRGALYNILRNPIYIGKVRHKEELHEGLHEAIIDDATWKLAQTQLADPGGKKIRSTRRPATRRPEQEAQAATALRRRWLPHW